MQHGHHSKNQSDTDSTQPYASGAYKRPEEGLNSYSFRLRHQQAGEVEGEEKETQNIPLITKSSQQDRKAEKTEGYKNMWSTWSWSQTDVIGWEMCPFRQFEHPALKWSRK